MLIPLSTERKRYIVCVTSAFSCYRGDEVGQQHCLENTSTRPIECYTHAMLSVNFFSYRFVIALLHLYLLHAIYRVFK